MRRLFSAVAVVTVVVLGGVSCAGDPASTPSSPAPDADSDTLSGAITVFAAASLTGAFEEMADEFEAENSGTEISFSFAGSSDLASQIAEGAPADVFASADESTMQKTVTQGAIDGEASLFAANTLQIVVPAGNPAAITDLASLSRDGVAVVVCAPQVPCGSATEKIERAAGIALSPVSEESSVTDVLAKVTSGEADAGLVYVTDVLRGGDAVEGIDFDESSAAVNFYPIAVTAGSANPTLAAAFVDFVLSDQGQALLADAGFAGA